MSIVSTTPADAMWPDPLDVRYIDGKNWLYLADFRFINPADGFPSLLIPRGSMTDFASIPQILWPILGGPTDHRIAKAAATHDELYRNPAHQITRAQADKVLRDGMKVLGADRLRRTAVWLGVRAGGWHSFQPRRTPR